MGRGQHRRDQAFCQWRRGADPDAHASEQSLITMVEFDELGGSMCSFERNELIRAAGTEHLIPWGEGKATWLVNCESEWAQMANLDSVPLAVGISGSTTQLFDSARILNAGGGTPVRAAAMGYLLYLHHSYH